MWAENPQKEDDSDEETSSEEEDSDEEDDDDDAGPSSSAGPAQELSREERRKEKKARKEAAIARAKAAAVQVGDLPPSDDEDDDDDEEDDDMPANPNHSKAARKQLIAANPDVDEAAAGVSRLAVAGKSTQPPQSRREREALEAAQAKERYMKLHEAGKTDEAKADLARLQEVREKRAAAAALRKVSSTWGGPFFFFYLSPRPTVQNWSLFLLPLATNKLTRMWSSSRPKTRSGRDKRISKVLRSGPRRLRGARPPWARLLRRVAKRRNRGRREFAKVSCPPPAERSHFVEISETFSLDIPVSQSTSHILGTFDVSVSETTSRRSPIYTRESDTISFATA